MNIRKWIAYNIGYRFFGCLYNSTHDPLFDFIESKIPQEFFDRKILDLGCGDGANTKRIERVFRTKNIIGFDRNVSLLKRARKKGQKVEKFDLDKDLPNGEIAAFTFSLHHAKNKEKTLDETVKKFNYIFLCEPIRGLYHIFFDAGEPLNKADWVMLFDNYLKKYTLHQYKNNLIVFYHKTEAVEAISKPMKNNKTVRAS